MERYRDFQKPAMNDKEEKKTAIDTVIECIDNFNALRQKNMNVKIKVSEIEALEETNPEFAEATRNGFSEDVIREFIIKAFDSLLEPIQLEKLQSSILVLIASVKFKKPINFAKFNGEEVYNYSKDKEAMATLRSPMFKKQCIVKDAINLMVEKKTISFNTALRRTIKKYEDESVLIKECNEESETFAEIAGIINQLINVYLENELVILSELGK